MWLNYILKIKIKKKKKYFFVFAINCCFFIFGNIFNILLNKSWIKRAKSQMIVTGIGSTKRNKLILLQL